LEALAEAKRREDDAAATKICAVWRGYMACKKFKATVKRLAKLCAIWKGKKARKEFVRIKDSTFTIQSFFRAKLLGNEAREQYK